MEEEKTLPPNNFFEISKKEETQKPGSLPLEKTFLAGETTGPETGPASPNPEPTANLTPDRSFEASSEEGVLRIGDYKSQTENMELPHHPHVHQQKKWKDYLFEFLLLFFAITAGFFVENQREYYIDHQREKQYIHSLIEDLQTDSRTMKRVYAQGIFQIIKLDSLVELANNEQLNNDIVYSMYILHSETGRFLAASFENRTSAQLKNAGGMRLIENKRISDTLRKYWSDIEKIESINSRLESAGESVIDFGAMLFNNKFLIRGNELLNPFQGIKKEATLINNDKKLMAQYSNRVNIKRNRTANYISKIEDLNELASRLIILIKVEYHIH